MIRKSASWALKPLQAPPPPPPPPEAPESPELKLSRLEVEIVPGVLPGAGAGGGRFRGLSDGDWAMIVARLGLSIRESEIIRYLVQERKDHAIAHELGMTYNTLRKQLSRLYRKLGVQTRVGVVVRAFETYIEMRQLETENGERQSPGSGTDANDV